MPEDLLGNDLQPYEASLLEHYEGLKALLGQDLPPVAAANVRAALAELYQAVNSLALVHEHLADLNV